MTGKETERIDALLDELHRARDAEAALAGRVRQLNDAIGLALQRHRDRTAPVEIIFELLAEDRATAPGQEYGR